ncbi:MAG TPA: hypothetical protein VFK25_02290, partial [Candidatus Binatia bacterium]|nr:hypothetical protein [Candidatus Binatia bacterium]
TGFQAQLSDPLIQQVSKVVDVFAIHGQRAPNAMASIIGERRQTSTGTVLPRISNEGHARP